MMDCCGKSLNGPAVPCSTSLVNIDEALKVTNSNVRSRYGQTSLPTCVCSDKQVQFYSQEVLVYMTNIVCSNLMVGCVAMELAFLQCHLTTVKCFVLPKHRVAPARSWPSISMRHSLPARIGICMKYSGNYSTCGGTTAASHYDWLGQVRISARTHNDEHFARGSCSHMSIRADLMTPYEHC